MEKLSHFGVPPSKDYAEMRAIIDRRAPDFSALKRGGLTRQALAILQGEPAWGKAGAAKLAISRALR
jgi:hypothetical protein